MCALAESRQLLFCWLIGESFSRYVEVSVHAQALQEFSLLFHRCKIGVTAKPDSTIDRSLLMEKGTQQILRATIPDVYIEVGDLR